MTIHNHVPLTPSDFNTAFLSLPSPSPYSPPTSSPPAPQASTSNPFGAWTEQSSAPRTLTSAAIAAVLRKAYPDLHLTINALNYIAPCDLLSFAAGGKATATPIGDPNSGFIETSYLPPPRRYGGGTGAMAKNVLFGCYEYAFRGDVFVLYVVDCNVGQMSRQRVHFVLSAPDQKGEFLVQGLLRAATDWAIELHQEMLVFNQGMWIKDAALWQEVQSSSWDDVILEEGKKKAVIGDVDGFFDGEATYEEFMIPWKRGIIFYGPPGNGKTISIKALMHSLSARMDPTVALLYVKTFRATMPPEYSIRAIFQRARAMAPCMLIFEDIDSLVTDAVRSYFLNEVDGLESNHGILMIGSTNHLDRLDPGISKRPSRFDRKYLFAMPTRDERVQYCQYWRHKLRKNEKVPFPEKLCGMIADITDDFSFAYMKEAFVASLLVIVNSTDGDNGGDGEAEKSVLWIEIQKQIKLLRDELGSKDVSL